MDRAPGVTCYNQLYPFEPNELAPLQGQLLPISHGETDTGSEMESLLTALPLSPAACWLDTLGSSGKKTSPCELKSDFSMNWGTELPWHLGSSQNQQNWHKWIFMPRSLTIEHPFVCFLASKDNTTGNAGPTEKEDREERKAKARSPPEEKMLLDASINC